MPPAPHPLPTTTHHYPHNNSHAIGRLTSPNIRTNQVERYDVCQALEHPYLRNLHFPEDEPRGPVIDRREFDFERVSLSTEEFKEEILHEVELYHQGATVRP